MAILQLSLHNRNLIRVRPLWTRRDYAGAGNSRTEVSLLERVKCFSSALRRRKKNATIIGHFGFVFKVTVYLQGCLASLYKRCSASSLNCRCLKPYIKLKLIGLAIRLYQQFCKTWYVEFFTTSKYERPNHLLNVTCQRQFCLFNVFLRFRVQSAKKHVCHLPYSISVKRYRTFYK